MKFSEPAPHATLRSDPPLWHEAVRIAPLQKVEAEGPGRSR